MPFFGTPAAQRTSLLSAGRFACESMAVESYGELLHQHLDVCAPVAGYWVAPDKEVGLPVMVFDSEEQAWNTAPPIEAASAPGATIHCTSGRRATA